MLHGAILHWRLFADTCEQSLRELEGDGRELEVAASWGPSTGQCDEGRTQPRAWRAAGVRVG